MSFLSVIPVYTHLLIAALLPLITASFASLRRPTNTLSPAQLKLVTVLQPATPTTSDEDDEDDDDDGEEEEHRHHSAVENLTASDALLFPITAGVTLGGLYLVIKYFDPAILSQALTWYFCIMGTYAVAKTASDILNIATQIIFPRRYFSRLAGRWYVASWDRWISENPTGIENVADPWKNFESLGLGVGWPKCAWKRVWGFRRAAWTAWVVKVSVPGGKGKVCVVTKKLFGRDLVGGLLGVGVVAAYVASGKYWLWTNVMGLSFSYGAIQLVSPTTFTTASLLLGALFLYDIYFVFFTPLMVTVATTLDIPIKLLFPRPALSSSSSKSGMAMLGLGDIVLPGLVIAMALRFDLWRVYETLRRRNLAKMHKINGTPVDYTADIVLAKPRFRPAMLDWGRKAWGGELGFGKEYFCAAVGGYIFGMVSTLVGMTWSGRAQPALLYLVPGVLGGIWGMAVWRGEVGLVWGYSEDGEEEDVKEEEKIKEKKKEEEEEEEEWDGEEKEVMGITVSKVLLGMRKGETESVESQSEGEVVDLTE
ncbi:hypothetical protein RUND412_007117 [Rhizina undulata]